MTDGIGVVSVRGQGRLSRPFSPARWGSWSLHHNESEGAGCCSEERLLLCLGDAAVLNQDHLQDGVAGRVSHEI